MSEAIDSTLAPEDRRLQRGAPAPRPQLYQVFCCDQPRAPTARHSLRDVDQVLVGRGDLGLVRSDEGGVRQLVLRYPDRWMSGSHARLSRTLGHWVLEDAPSKNGTLRNGHPTTRAVLEDGDIIEAGHTFFLFREAVASSADDPTDIDTSQLAAPALGLGTLAPPLIREFERIAAAARSKEEIVLFGDSGTGKEVIARAIHQLSGRGGEFVAVNCGAIPETLVESELFGYRKGAHSEAKEDRPGLLRAADRGTLFLDEIGDLPLSSQVKFLRVLQEREVMPVGATRPVGVDIRLVAATHQDLARRVAEGRFRSDLFARISGFTITLPTLSERREDFGLITAELLRHVDGADSVRFATDAVRALLRYRWPRNIRELEKSIRTAVVLAATHALLVEVEDLPREVQAALTQADDAAAPGDEAVLEELGEEDRQRRATIVELLEQHRGNISAAARALGKARMQVQRWIRRYRIDTERYR